tara:strand:- start:2995 stop:6306 length:3312 start_codon:yes stop_codon:yes gene_type:complete
MKLMQYNHLADEELTEDYLKKDFDFLDDASGFLKDRTGFESDDPNEIWNKFQEHMRFQSTNEITAMRDLYHVTTHGKYEKERLGRLMDVAERGNYGMFKGQDSILDTALNVGEGILDYGEAIVRSPATWGALFSAGGTKAGGIAATQGAKLGIKQIIKEGAKASVLPTAIEAGVGAITSASQEGTRVASGLKDDFSFGRVGMETAMAGAFGAALGTTAGAIDVKQGYKAGLLKMEHDKAAKAQVEIGKKKTQEILQGVNAKTAKEVKDYFTRNLKELPQGRVKQGKEIIEEEAPVGDFRKGEYENFTDITIPPETIDSIVASATEIIDVAGLKKTYSGRITEAIADAINDGSLGVESFEGILKSHNLTYDEFSSFFIADISNAARKLGSLGKGSRDIKNMITSSFNKLTPFGGEFMNRAERALLADPEMSSKTGKMISEFIGNANKFRISQMVIQPATTIRNVENGLLRTHVYALNNLFRGRNPMKLYQTMFNRQEADMIRMLYHENMPKAAQGTFRAAADIEQEMGTGSSLALLGRKMNYFNTTFDNYFKSSVFAAELDILVGKAGGNLKDIVAKGQFKQIDERIIAKASQAALEFTYQKGYSKASGKESHGAWFANKFISTFQKVVPSLFVPFPRYVINAGEFTYKHAPIIGMTDMFILNPLSKLTSGKPVSVVNRGNVGERVANQLTGSLMTFTALASIMSQDKPESVGPLEARMSNGNVAPLNAVLGPFSATYLLANFLYRSNAFELAETMDEPAFADMMKKISLGQIDINERPDTLQIYDVSQYWQPLLQSIAGGQFRVGAVPFIGSEVAKYFTGEDLTLSETSKRIGAKFIADIVGTFNVPWGILKDSVAFGWDEFRELPDNTDANILHMMIKHINRSMPRKTEGNLVNLSSASGLTGPVQERPLQMELKGDTPKIINPQDKQFLGLSQREPLKDIEEKVNEFQIPYSNWFIDTGQADWTYVSKEIMGKMIDLHWPKFSGEGSEYANSTKLRQREMLIGFLADMRTESKARAEKVLESLVKTGAYEYNPATKAKWDKLPSGTQRAINEAWMGIGNPNSDYFSKSTDVNKLGWDGKKDINEAQAWKWGLSEGKARVGR